MSRSNQTNRFVHVVLSHPERVVVRLVWMLYHEVLLVFHFHWTYSLWAQAVSFGVMVVRVFAVLFFWYDRYQYYTHVLPLEAPSYIVFEV